MNKKKERKEPIFRNGKRDLICHTRVWVARVGKVTRPVRTPARHLS